MPALLQLSARTNKVAMKRAEKTIQLICRYCHTDLILPFLSHALKDKALGLRIVAMSALITLVDASDPVRIGKRVGELERILSEHARDPNSEVRALCRELYAQYKSQWPERQARLVANLSPTSRRYLDGQSSSHSRSERPTPTKNNVSETSRLAKSPSSQSTPNYERQVTNLIALAKPVSTRRIYLTEQTHPDRSQARRTEETQLKKIVGVPTATDRSPKEFRPGASVSGNAVTLPDSDLTTPYKFSTPSEGVAYRLALAQEQARTHSSTGEARMRSRALLPSANLGGARRIQVGKPQSSMSRTLNGKECLIPSTTSKSVLNKPLTHSKDVSIRHATPDNTKAGTPTKSPSHAQFTPKRKPFGVVNEARIQSPERNNTVQ
ncbi:hypothetical protein MPSI1_000490 [Malassezia psittaci]|uniref:CLASP N-terminal domain-containing protein n=1 Tax=Malassezia psittaci TaxID=1821823 RepID=A0AAF0F876_9BASI|nr:hypothetical protein MPSI1_000490 [Malassezia psittaci]